MPLYRLEVLRYDESLEIAFISDSTVSLRPSVTAVRQRLPLIASKTLLQALQDHVEVFFPTRGFSGVYIGFAPQQESTTVYLLDGQERSMSGRIDTQTLITKITAGLAATHYGAKGLSSLNKKLQELEESQK